MMKEIEVSDVTNERLNELKQELYGGDIETDSFLFLLCDEVLEDD